MSETTLNTGNTNQQGVSYLSIASRLPHTHDTADFNDISAPVQVDDLLDEIGAENIQRMGSSWLGRMEYSTSSDTTVNSLVDQAVGYLRSQGASTRDIEAFLAGISTIEADIQNKSGLSVSGHTTYAQRPSSSLLALLQMLQALCSY